MKHIHFIGIKGVGMTPLAIIAKEAGFEVSGCDVAETFITDNALSKSGITPEIGFSPSHLDDVDMVITTGAHGGYNNKEVLSARERDILTVTQGEAVGMFMEGKIFHKQQKGISIAGCHGKTTTTAMIATILQHAKKDPSYIIGTSEISSLSEPGHFGKGEYFIAEADEYATEPTLIRKAKFLWQYPEVLVITNIEFDHPDMYEDIDEVWNAYNLLTKNIRKDGILIINGDDKRCQKIIENYKNKIVTFGFNSSNNYVLRNIRIEDGLSCFEIYKDAKLLDTFKTYAIGEHNALNALAAITASLETGLSIEQINKGLLTFRGTKRRFEYKGQLNSGAHLYDDYAHHPTEVKKSLEAFRSLYPNSRIVCIFQPHTFSRTKLLFDEFLCSFEPADETILMNIFASKRESMDISISSEKLVNALKEVHKNVLFLPESYDVLQYLKEKKFGSETVIITMGAGDIYKISEGLEFKK